MSRRDDRQTRRQSERWNERGRDRARSSSHELLVTREGRVSRVQRQPMRSAVLDAATRPLNVLVLAGLLTAEVLFSLPFAMVVLVYSLFVLASLVEIRTRTTEPGSFRVKEALLQLPPTLRAHVSGVLSIADAVRADLDDLPYEPEGVRDGLDQLSVTLIETAQRAAEANEYLDSIDRDDVAARVHATTSSAREDPSRQKIADALQEQLDVIDRLSERRRSLYRQMEEIGANLGAIQARVVQARVESDQPLEFDGELIELRDSTRALAESFVEVRDIAGSPGDSEHSDGD